MKTLEDLKALREKLKADMKVRQNDGTKIIIGMGTCGIAAGAREVMSAVLNELALCVNLMMFRYSRRAVSVCVRKKSW